VALQPQHHFVVGPSVNRTRALVVALDIVQRHEHAVNGGVKKFHAIDICGKW
jgi:hypothetical protein